ncbi:LysR family transcriptional regulator [Actinomadura flavalba]|uniref:LysR family transcriptional regulator n=1 Tax=Actinomadura flavalba TaxID=1120938 RepID=UPI00037C650C|nr:LysR family transcriptional regulator [Actinomadura flavalba]
MELRQLRYFVAVVEEGSFTRAAERLHVAQPGVSAQVRGLEREFGETLLDRSGRSVTPTAAGEAVLPYARAALAAVEDARAAVDDLRGLVRGRVAVGVVTSVPSALLPDILAGFHRDHPDVEITLSEGRTDRLLAGLRDGDLDLAVLGVWGTPPPGVAVHVILEERLVAVVAPDDPLASAGDVPLTALRGRKLAGLPAGTGLRAVVEDACARAGFTPDITLEAADPLVLAQLAARGLGTALVPASLAAAHADELTTVEIAGGTLRGDLVLAWPAEGPRSPAARTLLTRARTAL